MSGTGNNSGTGHGRPARLASGRQADGAGSRGFPDGRDFTGDPPGLRIVQRGQFMLVYLTDVRGERVVISQVNWMS